MSQYVAPSSPSRLWQWLQKVKPYPKSLAWCHTTDAYRLRSIIETGLFTPNHCRVFDENLLYFFYGRPAFRKEEDQQFRLSSRAPVVVILSPDLIDEGKRLFPFDTGAFEDRYRKWMHPSMKLCDFELACSGDEPQRHVAAFFGTNTDYLRLKYCNPPLPYKGEFEVESIVELLKDPDTGVADDRRMAMELQVGDKVKFDTSSIWALIVPDELLQAPFFVDFRNGIGIGVELITYEIVPLRKAGHYQGLLEEKASSMQKSRGLI